MAPVRTRKGDPLAELAVTTPVPEPEPAPDDFEGIDVFDLEEETAVCTVTLPNGKSFPVEYYQLRITPQKMLAAVEVVKETNVPSGGVIFLLNDIVKAWGVKRGNTLVPITIEALQTLPEPFLTEVWRQVREHSLPNETTSSPSRGFSARGATTATFRGGTA